MAIQNRRGVYANLDKAKLVPGEFAFCMDNGALYYCYAAGSVRQLSTKEDVQSILDSSEAAYTALQQLIADLGNQTTLTSLLNTQSDVNGAKVGEVTLTAKVQKIDSELAAIENNVETNYLRKDESTNGNYPLEVVGWTYLYANLPTASETNKGGFLYCTDGDGTHGAGNYRSSGTSWYFGGTGDQGYNKLKGDIGNYTQITKPIINPLLAAINYGTNTNYGEYELEIYKDGGSFGFGYFNEPHSVLFDAYINGDEGVKFVLTSITSAAFQFVSVRGTDAGTLYSFNRTTNEVSVVSKSNCLDNIANNDRIIIYFVSATMYICNRSKNTLNYIQNGVTAFGFVSGGNQGIISKYFVGIENCFFMISDLVTIGVIKKCINFGDSITWYDGKIPDMDWTTMKTGTIPIKGYIAYIKELLGYSIENKGISGETSIQICDRIKNTNLTGYDILTLTGGTNDFLQGLTIGTIQPIGNVQNTDTTFYGAVQSAIEYVLTNYPSTCIILMTPIRGWKNAKTAPAVMPDDIPNALIAIAKLYGLPIADWYNEIGINEINKATFCIDDITNVNVDYYVHPNNDYQKKMGYKLVNVIKGMG